jgi:hypothetical protein
MGGNENKTIGGKTTTLNIKTGELRKVEETTMKWTSISKIISFLIIAVATFCVGQVQALAHNRLDLHYTHNIDVSTGGFTEHRMVLSHGIHNMDNHIMPAANHMHLDRQLGIDLKHNHNLLKNEGILPVDHDLLKGHELRAEQRDEQNSFIHDHELDSVGGTSAGDRKPTNFAAGNPAFHTSNHFMNVNYRNEPNSAPEALVHENRHDHLNYLDSHPRSSLALTDRKDHGAFPVIGDAAAFFQTQHRAVAGDTEKEKARKELIKNIEWQWANNPVSMLNAMKAWFSDKNAALAVLKAGQENNPGAQKNYDLAVTQWSDFWSLVFYQTSWEADFSTLETSLKWQLGNEWASLNSSRESWNAQPRNEEWAYYNLLWGQRQNWEVLRNYRAGWNQNKAKVMELVEKVWKK